MYGIYLFYYVIN